MAVPRILLEIYSYKFAWLMSCGSILPAVDSCTE